MLHVEQEPRNDVGDIVRFPVAVNVRLAKSNVTVEQTFSEEPGPDDSHRCLQRGTAFATSDLLAIGERQKERSLLHSLECFKDECFIERSPRERGLRILQDLSVVHKRPLAAN